MVESIYRKNAYSDQYYGEGDFELKEKQAFKLLGDQGLTKNEIRYLLREFVYKFDVEEREKVAFSKRHFGPSGEVREIEKIKNNKINNYISQLSCQ